MPYSDPEFALLEAYLNEQNRNPRTSLGTRGDYLQDQIDKYRRGEVTYPETLFGLARSAGGAVSDPITEAIGALTPDLGLTEWLSQTTPVQKTAEGIKYMEENYPRTSNIVGGVMGAAELTGLPALLRSVANPKQGLLRNFVSNMPNKLETFYSGPVGQAKGLLQTFGGGAVNTLKQNLTPRGLALREADIPVELKDKVANAYKKAEEIKVQSAAKREEVFNSNLPDKEKEARLKEIDDKEKGDIATLGKNIEGQKQHVFMTNTQYDVDVPPLIKESTNRVNLATGDYTLETFKKFIPDAPDEIFDVITKNQGMKPGEGKLVLRNPTGMAAGDLRRDVVGGAKSAEKGRSSKVAKAAYNAFGEQDKVYGFASPREFLDAANQKKLTSLQAAKLNDPEFQKQLRKAFKDEPLLKFAQTADKLQTLLKKNGIKVDKKIVEAAFRKSGRTPFQNTDDLIASLEKQGLKISETERKKAKERGYVILSDSFVSGAIDLGGVNGVHAIWPDGKKMTFINDGYDLKGKVPFGAKRLVNVAHWTEDMLGPNPSTNGPLKADPALRPKEPSPFSKVMSLQQQKGAEDILNFEPAVSGLNTAKALRNNLFLGSVGASTLANPLLGMAGEEE